MNTLKTIDFVTTIHLTPALDNSTFIFGQQLKILGNKQTKKNKIPKLKSVFFWKTIVFKVMRAISYPLISEYRYIYFSMKRQWNGVIVQKFSYDKKDKAKTTVKQKI